MSELEYVSDFRVASESGACAVKVKKKRYLLQKLDPNSKKKDS